MKAIDLIIIVKMPLAYDYTIVVCWLGIWITNDCEHLRRLYKHRISDKSFLNAPTLPLKGLKTCQQSQLYIAQRMLFCQINIDLNYCQIAFVLAGNVYAPFSRCVFMVQLSSQHISFQDFIYYCNTSKEYYEKDKAHHMPFSLFHNSNFISIHNITIHNY